MKKILVVDDEQEIVASISDYLREAGYRPVPAFDGESALSAFESEEPELVRGDEWKRRPRWRSRPRPAP